MLKCHGYTLLELIFVILLLGLLASLAITSYSSLARKNEGETWKSEIETDLHYAKMQALLLQHPVILVPLGDEDDWSKGMRLLHWNTEKQQMELLLEWQWHHPGWQITWSGAHSSKNIEVADRPSKSMTNGRFILSNKHYKQQITIIINRLGRARSVLDKAIA
jgi:prepilin-type N-terminal cleavage/methylation domain-containing protein